MNFCPKCGAKVKEGQTFCSKCGSKLINNAQKSNAIKKAEPQEKKMAEPVKKDDKEIAAVKPQKESGVVEGVVVSEENELPPENNGKRKISKKCIAAICVIAAILAALFCTGYFMTRPSKVISEFEKDVASGNKADLCNVLYCSDSRLSINKNSISPLLLYFKTNPAYLNESVQDLNNQAAGCTSKGALIFQKVGNKYIFFPDYRVVIKPAFLEISTKVNNAELILNNNKIGESDSDNFSKEYGPYIPGQYNLVAKYKGSYANIDESHSIDLVTPSDNKADIKVLQKLKYLKITSSSDYDDAKIFVNNKDTGVKISDAENFGPVKVDSKVYAVETKDGQKLKSNIYTVKSDDNSDADLDFSRSESSLEDEEGQIKDLLGMYINNFTESVNSGDFSILAPDLYPGSNFYKQQSSYVPYTYGKQITEYNQSYNITSYSMSDDKKSGTVDTDEFYQICSNGTSSTKEFKYRYTFKYNDQTQSYQFSDMQDLQSKS